MAKWKWNTMQEQAFREAQENLMRSGNDAMNAEDQVRSNLILEKAKKIINGDRREEYGEAERSFDTISKFWNIYQGRCMGDRITFDPTDVAMMMILLKVGRTDNRPTEDSLVDICGYAALAADMLD